MKKVLILALLAPSFLFGQQNKFAQLGEELPTPNEYRNAAGAPGHNYYQQKADYDIEVILDDKNQKITGEETITYTNNSPDNLEYLWIQLDQNVRALDSDSKLITIEKMEDKSQIGMVVAAWSQSFRKDYQHNHSKGHEYVLYDYGQWMAERVNPHGDIFSWIRKSLRTYKNLEYMCERYNIPYVQTQMIPLYIDWLRGLPPTDQAIMFEGKDMIGDRNEYPGDAVEDEESLLKILIELKNISHIQIMNYLELVIYIHKVFYF